MGGWVIDRLSNLTAWFKVHVVHDEFECEDGRVRVVTAVTDAAV